MPYCSKCGNELKDDAKFCPKCGAPVEAPPVAVAARAEAPKEGLRVAFWGERFIAWLIDVIIIGFIVGVIGLFTWLVAWQPYPGLPGWFPLFNFGGGGIIYFLYWTLTEGSYGRSIGKMVMRLKVVKLDGSRIGFGEAAIESVGKAFLLLLDVIIGWILFSRRRQRIFNYLSGTAVVRG